MRCYKTLPEYTTQLKSPKVPSEKEKWIKFHDRQYQFKVSFMLYADFESILRPADERYKDKMNTMKAERRGKAPYIEKIKKHVPSGWYIHSTFSYGDVPDSLKIYCGKERVEKLMGNREDEVRRLYATAAHDRAYSCVKKRTRCSRKVLYLSRRAQ